MLPYQHDFIEFAIQRDVLRFGEFTLKSGRVSPYFFNSGLFMDGESLDRLGRYYADALLTAGFGFDMLFGPAYKGIPLVSALAMALHRDHGRSVPWCFNRKEAKDHGEGGSLLGAPLAGRVVIVDDVVTAGTSVRESLALIRAAGARAAGVVISLDRRERGVGGVSAVQEIERDLGLPVASIVSLDELIEYLAGDERLQQYSGEIQAYRAEYGA